MTDYSEKDISNLLYYGEHISLECKKAAEGFPKSFWDTYSSFANTVGGDIILGINENLTEIDPQKRFSINGIKDSIQMKKILWDTINSDKVNCNLLREDDIWIGKFRDKELMIVHVPQARYTQRPVYINGNPIKGTFKRNYEGDYHADEEEVKAMLRDSSETGIDGQLIEYYTFDDLDSETIRAYRQRFNLRNSSHVWNDIDDVSFMRNMGALATDRVTGKEWLTLAGLLMFGKSIPVQERFDNIRLDYLDKTNLVGDSRWSDRLTYDGRWETNLYNFLVKVLPKLTFEIKRPFRLDGMERDEETEIHKAIRESVANLIIHADYLISGILKIEKVDDGFIFNNPGRLKIPIEEIYKGGNSTARNPRMQKMLRMIGIGDNIGSGFPTILKAWQKENWRKPLLIENQELHTVTLKLTMVSLFPEETTSALNSLFGDEYRTLSSECQMVLAIAYQSGYVSNADLRPLLGLNTIEVGRLLNFLVTKGFLLSDGIGRGTTYCVNRRNTTVNTTVNTPDSIDALIINEIEKNPSVRYATLASVAQRHRDTISRHIQKLIAAGVIKREGSDKNGRWIVLK